jgi:enoyl-CoA hydratase/3-hydroxyacyl-CoA dehydrogenase
MEAATAEMTVVDRFQLKAFVEAAMLVDEGVATTKDVDLGLMMGAGILPGPLARADEAGLDRDARPSRARPARVGRRLRHRSCFGDS